MKFTLIVATLGRSIEIERLFESLLKQSYKKFNIIIVDQNTDDRVYNLYEHYKDKLEIIYIHTDQKGLSNARNLGLKCTLNDIIAFPDDDCWYPENTLKYINELFINKKIDIITGKPIDAKGNVLLNNYLKKSAPLDLKNVWNGGISFTIFLSKVAIKKIGYFDKNLGVGSMTPYGSGEETDYLIRGIKSGLNIHYFAELTIFHPKKGTSKNNAAIKRAFSYGCGMGYVLKKHNYTWKIKLMSLIRPLGGCFIALALFDFHLATFRWHTFRGRINGLKSIIN